MWKRIWKKVTGNRRIPKKALGALAAAAAAVLMAVFVQEKPTRSTLLTVSYSAPSTSTLSDASPSRAGMEELSAQGTETSGREIKAGWLCMDGVIRYYINGTMLSGTWANIGGRRYYFYQDGAMAYGISDINGERYAFSPSGAFVTGSWLQISGDWFLTDEDGKLLTGYQWVNGRQYYISEDGKLQQGGVTPDGMYILNADGMVVSLNLQTKKGQCPLSSAPGTSGYEIGGYPVELFMLSMAGETSGGQIVNGDGGRAYGLCQFDYRYDLADFIRYAYQIHPALWSGFADLAETCEAGDETLVSNETITDAFALAEALSPATCAADQISFLYNRYFANTYSQLQNAGYLLEGRNIAVSAVILSINVNCGEHPALYLSALSPEMSDAEMIDALYLLRNTELTKNGKGTNRRYLESEPELARQLLYGEVTVLSSVEKDGGVSWSKSALRFCGETLSEAQIEARLESLGPGFFGVSDSQEMASPSDAMEEETAAEEETMETMETSESGMSPVIEAGTGAAEETAESTEKEAETT